MSAPLGLDPERFSASSLEALNWARHRAALRASTGGGRSLSKVAQTARVFAGEVQVPDLLAGILLARGDQAEPAVLLRMAGLSVDRLDEVLAPSGFTPGSSPEPPPYEELPRDFDLEAGSALDQALALAEGLSPEGPRVRLRDLFGGILLGSSQGPSLMSAALSGSTLDLEDLLNRYPDYLSLRTGSSDLAAFLSGGDEAPTVEADLLPRVAVLDADTPGTDDWVGIGPEVDALARLMVSPSLHPPLAVGLFGDWGSGKSFFMQAIRNRVLGLTEAARGSTRPQAELGVYRHVSQIDFNAWHYVEGNLWASLTEHIFQSLGGSVEEGPEARIQLWTRELESQQVARAEVSRRLASLRDERTRRAGELEAGRARRRAKLQALQRVRTRDVLEEVMLDPEVREPVQALLTHVGLVELRESARETREALGDVRAVLQRGNGLLTPLRRRGRDGWRWALLLVAVALAGPAVAWLLTLIPGGSVDSVTRTFTGIAAFLSSLTLVLRQGSGWLSSSLERVEEAQARLDRARARRAEELAQEEVGLQHELDVLDDEVTRLADRKAEVESRIRSIEAELGSLTPSRLLSDFIDERVGSEDYRKHLGVPALVRRDFHRLSNLIRDRNRALMEERDPGGDGLPLVNRVILYIDDLDRCPPDRVVEVLQAVHLLLAFELFVVVVAVDSRWLSRSLVSRYRSLLGEAGGGQGSPAATPDDYLEKIFQIPFHVRPLDDGAQQRLLDGLLLSTVPPAGNAPATEEGVEGQEPDRESNVGTTTATDGIRSEANQGDDLPAHGGAGAEEEQTEGPVRRRDDRISSPRWSRVTSGDLEAGHLVIRPGEAAFMEELRPLLGRTPRAMKRFVNVYRLLSAIAEPRTAGYYPPNPDPDDPLPPPYRRAMFLLAVVTGLPGMSAEIVRAIRDGSEAVRREQRTDENTDLEWVLTLHARGGLVLRPEGPGPEYRRLSGWLRTHDGGRWTNLPVTTLEPWVDPVRRFSFRTEVGIDP